MKTIKQIADELGVSKTAVRKRLTPEVQTKFAETVSGVIYISTEGETLIKQGFKRPEPQTKFAEVSANQFAEVSGEVSTLISMLQRELDAKNAQIAELTATVKTQAKTIAAAQLTVNTAQALHAGTIRRQLTKTTAGELSVTDKPTEPGFFSRIFKRKNN